MSTVAKVNPRANQGQTTQGFYVIGADGSAYVYNNNRSVERVQDFLQRGLKAFKASPPAKADIPDAPDMQRKAPAGTTILRIYSRIKPVPMGADTANENVQRDHFWLLPQEVAALSTSNSVPESLSARLCRFVFVDAIRGEPDFWSAGEIKSKEFSITKLSSGELKIVGKFAMATGNQARGLEGSLEAIVRVNGERVTAFKGFVNATAWGKGTYTPNPPNGKFPIKFAIVIAPNTPDTVSPQAAFYGPEYLKG
ncbi:MAG: hypothetical protein KF784_07245 [Fimbriimonadaceae bacterium]|nr:hypothetical protein [Fimbriimonadaceae bacterium]